MVTYMNVASAIKTAKYFSDWYFTYTSLQFKQNTAYCTTLYQTNSTENSPEANSCCGGKNSSCRLSNMHIEYTYCHP